MTYALAFFVALVIATIATPVTMKLAGRWGAIAYPGGRHVHTKPIPRLGGLAMYAAFWIAALVIQLWDKSYTMDETAIMQIWGLFIGSTIITMVGIWDDIRGMRPFVKLIWQIAAASILLAFGFSMNVISLPLIGEINFVTHGIGVI